MFEGSSEILTLSPDDGWLRDGESWQPSQPFYAVLGDPIAHSLSPAMFAAGLQERELPLEYLAAQIRVNQVSRLKRLADRNGLAGFNVTAPLKTEVASYCDGRTDAAREAGAVNTVMVEENRWLGHNTDIGGVEAVLAQAWPDEQTPTAGIVLGGGGAARASACALAHSGVSQITLLNRSAEGRRSLKKWLEKSAPDDLTARTSVAPLVPLVDGNVPQEATVWVSCLPRDVDILPFLPEAAGSETCLLLDLRYGSQLPPYQPPLGFQSIDGEPVLLLQGGLSFAWWFGLPVPWQAMRDGLAT